MVKVRTTFKWFKITKEGTLKEADSEREDCYGEKSFLQNDDFDSEVDAVNALVEFYEGEYRSDSYVLIKSYSVGSRYA